MGYDFSIGEAEMYAPTAEEIDTGYDRAELRVRVTPLRTEDDGALLDGGYGWFLGWTRRVGRGDRARPTRGGPVRAGGAGGAARRVDADTIPWDRTRAGI